MPLNTVTFSVRCGEANRVYSGKVLIRRSIWDRPHGVIAVILHIVQLRHALSLHPLSPGDHSVPLHVTACTGRGYGHDGADTGGAGRVQGGTGVVHRIQSVPRLPSRYRLYTVLYSISPCRAL